MDTKFDEYGQIITPGIDSGKISSDLLVVRGLAPLTNVYYGRVVSVHDGFCYIGQVKKSYETINTNGDVFCPKVFPVGTVVRFFELNTDPKRPEKFRVEDAEAVSEQLLKTDTGAVLAKLMERSTYHSNAKVISPEKLKEAWANQPLAELLHRESGATPKPIDEMAKVFLAATYPGLESIRVSYNVDGKLDENEEQKLLKEAIKKYEAAGMNGQADAVEAEFYRFKAIRNAFTLMHKQGILSLDTVIPMRLLPDMLVAAPVWYCSNVSASGFNNQVRRFCDLGKTKAFAWLFQMYNWPNRPIETFASPRDIMPLPILDILALAKHTFDVVVIATPYHDLASQDWATSAWRRNVDPFLLGFIQGLDYFFVLGRWSGTGIFPLFVDMVADTMDHLRVNLNNLSKVSRGIPWMHGPREGSILEDDKRGDNAVLKPFAEQLISAYEQGQLFNFLRDEWQIEEKAA